jgi:hypothetical protein
VLPLKAKYFSDIYCSYFCSFCSDADLMQYVWHLYDARDSPSLRSSTSSTKSPLSLVWALRLGRRRQHWRNQVSYLSTSVLDIVGMAECGDYHKCDDVGRHGRLSLRLGDEATTVVCCYSCNSMINYINEWLCIVVLANSIRQIRPRFWRRASTFWLYSASFRCSRALRRSQDLSMP